MTINPTSTPCVYLGCEEEVLPGSVACKAHDAPALAVPQLPTQTRLTTDEAENGALWAFARSYERFASVTPAGSVYFSDIEFLVKGGAPQRKAWDVVVDGVVTPINRQRVVYAPVAPMATAVAGKPLCHTFDCLEFALPNDLCCAGHASWHSKVASPEVGVPYPTLEVAYPAPGLREDGLEPAEPVAEEDEAHGWTDELEAAKERARYLLTQWDGGSQQLSAVQYIAIFGELPQ